MANATSILSAEKLWLSVNIEAIAATRTLLVTDKQLQVLDPSGAARTVLLPAEADSDGLFFVVVNSADAAEVISVKEDSGTTTIASLLQNEQCIVVCDGVTWKGIVGGAT